MSASEAAEIRYVVVDGIAVITLNRPERLNALLPGMGADYAARLREADADPQVRAIVVTGAGRGFCSGADLAVLAQGPQALEGYLEEQNLADLPTVALQIGTPVVTAVNGPCAGIGFVLALAADLRIAAPTATFSSSFSRLGLIAEYGIAWLLPRLIGLPAATEILISGRTLDAAEALHLGLVQRIEADPLAAAMAWAREIAAGCAPAAIAVIKAQLLAAQDQGMEGAVLRSLELMRESFARPDLPEALMARAEKRPPRFAPRT